MNEHLQHTRDHLLILVTPWHVCQFFGTRDDGFVLRLCGFHVSEEVYRMDFGCSIWKPDLKSTIEPLTRKGLCNVSCMRAEVYTSNTKSYRRKSTSVRERGVASYLQQLKRMATGLPPLIAMIWSGFSTVKSVLRSLYSVYHNGISSRLSACLLDTPRRTTMTCAKACRASARGRADF